MLASAGPISRDDRDFELSGEVTNLELGEQSVPVVQALPPGAAPPQVPVSESVVPQAEPQGHPAPATAAEGENVIVVSPSARDIEADPASDVNAAAFEAVNAIDDAVVAPLTSAYEKATPEPVRNGLRNVLLNLTEPIVFLNYLLQFKPGKALETVGRFGINSTLGVAGLFDMAKRRPFRLPYRQNGFANTLAYHGVGTGPYLFLPVLGPTTVRDLVGRLADVSVVPTLFGSPFNKPVYSIGTSAFKAMNDRIAFNEQIQADRATADPYVATRDFYLKRRQAEVDALHSPEYRARKRIPEATLPPVAPVSDAPAMAPGPVPNPGASNSAHPATPGPVGDARRP